MLARFTPIRLLVTFVILTALLALGVAWIGREPFPGLLPLMGFLFVALLLESDQTSLRVQASGSTSFIIQLGAVLVFGAFWAALVAWMGTRSSAARKVKWRIRMRLIPVSGYGP